MRARDSSSVDAESTSGGGGSGKVFRNGVFLLCLSVILFLFYYGNTASISSFKPQLELVTNIEENGSNTTSTTASRMLDAQQTEKILREAKEAKEAAQKAKAEAERMKSEVAKAKEEAVTAQTQAKQAKGEAEISKLEAEKLRLEIAQSRAAEAEASAAKVTQIQAEPETNDSSNNNKPPPVQEDEPKTNADTDSNNNNNKNKPLNVIIFYPDDWGGRDLQDVNPILKTPTFTQLAKDGIRFTHNAVTTSICWISRANLFTGQYVSTHKAMYLFRPTFTTKKSWPKTWPYLLQKLGGYFVGHVGKWQYRDTGNLNSLFNWSSFFEGWTVIIDKHRGNRTYNAEMARDETIRFLRERPKDKPFAATIAFYPPKGICKVREVKPELAALYTNITHPEAYDRAMAYSRLPPFLQDNETEARKRYLYRFETHGDFQENIAAQYATLTHIDAMCGEIIEELKAQGVYDNTMIIVTADNGEFHGAHALADKWYPYSESIHVPLIIRDPRMPQKKRGTLDYSFTLNIDLAETILGAAGLDPHEEMEGRDISDLYLDNPKSTKPWREEFYYDFPQVNAAIPASSALVRKDWKYIDWYLNNSEELFDMKNDPFELNNVANRSEYAELKAEMRHRMEVLKHNIYYPRVPNSRCDPLQPSGGDRKSLPNCSLVLPDYCCPDWFQDNTI